MPKKKSVPGCKLCASPHREEIEQLYVENGIGGSVQSFYKEFVVPIAPEISYSTCGNHFTGNQKINQKTGEGYRTDPHFDLLVSEIKTDIYAVKNQAIQDSIYILSSAVKGIRNDPDKLKALKIGDALRIGQKAIELLQADDKIDMQRKELDDKSGDRKNMIAAVQAGLLSGGDLIKEKIIDVTTGDNGRA